MKKQNESLALYSIFIILGIFISFVSNFFLGDQALTFLVVVSIGVLIIIALYYIKNSEAKK